MVAKVILNFLIICTTQVFSLELEINAESELSALGLGSQKRLSNLDLPNNTNLKNILETLKETEGKRKKFGELATLSVLEPGLRENNNKARTCFEKQTEKSIELMHYFYEETVKVISEIDKDLSQKPNKKHRIGTILDQILELVNLNLDNLNKFLLKGKNTQAADSLSKLRTKIQEYDDKFINQVIKYGQNSPKKAQKIGNGYYKVRKVAQQKSKAINNELEKCLKS